MKKQARGVLVEQGPIKQHYHFDSVPYSNMRMVDVARVLDVETARPRLNQSVVNKLINRVLTGLEHTILALQGRPEGMRVIGLLHRSFNRIIERIPELTNESVGKMHSVLSLLPEDQSATPLPSPLTERLVLKNYRTYAERIADAYDARPVYEAAAKASYDALRRHNYRMFKQILSRVRVVFGSESAKDYELGVSGGPYKDAADMTRRVKETGVLLVNTDFSENLASGWSPKDNWVFRAVHDYVVHIGGNHDFSLRGEIGTFNRHAKILPRTALPAAFSEVVGQAAYAIVRNKFPNPQKACILYGFDYINVGVIDEDEYAKNFEGA